MIVGNYSYYIAPNSNEVTKQSLKNGTSEIIFSNEDIEYDFSSITDLGDGMIMINLKSKESLEDSYIIVTDREKELEFKIKRANDNYEVLKDFEIKKLKYVQ